MGLYRLGAHVTCTERPKELGRLEASIAQQKASQGKGVLESALELYGRAAQPAAGATGVSPVASNSDAATSATTAAAPATARDGQAQGQAETPQAGGQSQEQGSITTAALEWGEEGFTRSPLSTQQLAPFDFIICSELYYVSGAEPRAVL
jgi:hypothetical protein